MTIPTPQPELFKIYASRILHRHYHGNSHRNMLKSHTQSERNVENNVKKNTWKNTWRISSVTPQKNTILAHRKTSWLGPDALHGGLGCLPWKWPKLCSMSYPWIFMEESMDYPWKTHGFYPWKTMDFSMISMGTMDSSIKIHGKKKFITSGYIYHHLFSGTLQQLSNPLGPHLVWDLAQFSSWWWSIVWISN